MDVRGKGKGGALRVYVYPADAYGCGHYRLIWPALAVKEQGLADITVVLPDERRGQIGVDTDTRTGRRWPIYPPDADVIVMQRITRDLLRDTIRMVVARGVAVVVDMDDDLDRVDPSNPAWAGVHPRLGARGHNAANAASACRSATLTTVSTPALADRYPAAWGSGIGKAELRPGLVLRNAVPRSFLEVEHTDSAVIGWPGSVHSHPIDLQEVGPSVARLVREGVEYLGVGPVAGLRQGLGLDSDPDTLGAVDFAGWPQAVAQLGVGLAPLVDTEFNRAKSWLKLLEMNAAGVPWVASPRAEYERYLRESAGAGGLLAKGPRQWYTLVKRLATDERERRALSESGRAFAAEHTIEKHAWRWAEAWHEAARIAQSRRRAA